MPIFVLLPLSAALLVLSAPLHLAGLVGPHSVGIRSHAPAPAAQHPKSAPVFSRGTISIAPSPQVFAAPGSHRSGRHGMRHLLPPQVLSRI